MPAVNRFGNWLFNKLLAISHGLEGSDQPHGPLRDPPLEAIRLGTEARGFDIETEIGIKAKARGLREATIPISYLPGSGRRSSVPGRTAADPRPGDRAAADLQPDAHLHRPGLLLMAISITGAILLSSGPVGPPTWG